jgi:DNA-binding response OmpR family regulator
MENKRILIADDEERMRKLASDFLKRESFIVDEAVDGQEAMTKFSKTDYDLVILDVMMPKLDGWQVCKEIRSQSSVPIMMLTAKEQEADEIYGFELGADEYVTKPFSPMIFVKRVKALLRRHDEPENTILVFEELIIDIRKHDVLINQIKIDLSPKEYDLLIYLARNKDIALSREQILTSVWHYDYFGDSRTVDTHVKRLRLKLEKYGKYIQTVRGLGYRFEVIK